MATWEDGPEYAPLERPQYYADAPAAPLEQAPPLVPLAGGPSGVQPRFASPSAPVAPLETLVPQPPDERDPSRPFDVLTATMTTGSAWGSGPVDQAFSPTAPLPTRAAVDEPSGWAAPTRTPTSTPTSTPPGFPPPSSSVAVQQPQLPANPYAYPAPGTPGWFAPAPATYGEQGGPGRVDAKRVVEAATPGLCICLAIGGLIYPLAPVMLLVAVFLSTRVRVASRVVRAGFRVAIGVVAFFAVIGLFRLVVDGNPWYHFVALWSLLICWVSLVGLLLTVWRALRRPAPPSPSPWG